MEFIINNLSVIIALIAMLAIAILAVYGFVLSPRSVQMEKIRQWLIYAVAYAEHELGGGTGELKLRMVYDMFINQFPFTAKLISFNKFCELVDYALTTFKKMLESSKEIEYVVTHRDIYE